MPAGASGSATPRSRKCILSSSVDHGATWTTLSIDKADGCAGVPMSGTDGTAYATLSGLLASIPPSVLVSHDGWKTWQKTQLGTPPVDLIAVLPDGALLAAPRHVTSPGKPATSAAPGFLLSRDGGKTFQQIAGTAGFSSLKTTAVGSYIGSSNSGEPGKQSISDDGEHWSKAPQVPGQKYLRTRTAVMPHGGCGGRTRCRRRSYERWPDRTKCWPRTARRPGCGRCH